MAGEPILVVDDNPTNLKLTKVLLTHAGYQVRTAGDGEEARFVAKGAIVEIARAAGREIACRNG